MKYKNLKIGERDYTNHKNIETHLKKEGFYWVIDAEIEDADIEVRNSTLIWNGGRWVYGTWEYGIFMDGEFHGKWENGIFESGIFKGEWISGIDYTQKIKN